MNSIPVVAVITAKPGLEKPLEQLLRGLLAPTHQEAGSVTYALHRSRENPRTFVFIEKWASPDALNAHLGAPHIAAALSRREELIEEFRVIPLESVPGGDPVKGTF